jgi:hypothetical protein
LFLLLVHPGLIALTSELLTDTFATDLVMLVGTILIYARGIGGWRLGLNAAGFGALTGWLIAARPVMVVSTIVLALLMALYGMFPTTRRRTLTFVGIFGVVTSLFLLPSALKCRSTYGKVCLQNPIFSGQAAGDSLQLGLVTYRTYWSVRSPSPSTIVIPQDFALVEAWRSTCDISEVSGPSSWSRCIFSRPFYIPIYGAKKVIALFDHLFLHPYATDVTPTWVIGLNRLFGVLAFVGFLFSLGLSVLFFRRRNFAAFFTFIFPTLILLFQVPMHVESRYGFPAVPIALVSLVWGFQYAYSYGRKALVGALVLALLFAGVFFGQVRAWDRMDPVFLQVMGWDRD